MSLPTEIYFQIQNILKKDKFWKHRELLRPFFQRHVQIGEILKDVFASTPSAGTVVVEYNEGEFVVHDVLRVDKQMRTLEYRYTGHISDRSPTPTLLHVVVVRGKEGERFGFEFCLKNMDLFKFWF